MSNTITVEPNQSMLDVIIQSCGTLEGGMQMMLANTNKSISDIPDVGDVINVNSIQRADPDTLLYLQQNSIVIGTLGILPPVPHSFRAVLAPYMAAVKNPVDALIDPATLGYWDMILVQVFTKFIQVYGLPATIYVSNPNLVWYASEAKIQSAGFTLAAASRNDEGSPLMTAVSVNYHIPYNTYSMGGPYVFVMSDLFVNGTCNSLQFQDNNGNVAVVAPLIVLALGSQGILDTLLPDLLVELYAEAGGGLELRLTLSHSSIACPHIGTVTLSFVDEAFGGVPDPGDPTNANKTIVTLAYGTHLLGARAMYMDIDGVTLLGYSQIECVVEVS